MDSQRPFATLVASALLGVLAVAGVVAGAFMLFGAWVLRIEGPHHMLEIGIGAAVLVGILLIAFAVLAAVAARDEFRGRPHGRVLGLVVGIVAALAAGTALLVGEAGESTPLLYIAIGVGVITVIALLFEPQPRLRSEHGTT